VEPVCGRHRGAVKGDPEGQTIEIDSRGDWDLPVGSVVLKHFRLNGKLIETRSHPPAGSGWTGYTYEWRTPRTTRAS
jgi:hypothetical protein